MPRARRNKNNTKNNINLARNNIILICHIYLAPVRRAPLPVLPIQFAKLRPSLAAGLLHLYPKLGRSPIAGHVGEHNLIPHHHKMRRETCIRNFCGCHIHNNNILRCDLLSLYARNVPIKVKKIHSFSKRKRFLESTFLVRSIF